MTHFEYELAFRAVIGLAGCAIALLAIWRDRTQTYTLDFGDKPITTTWTSRRGVVRQRETDEVTNT